MGYLIIPLNLSFMMASNIGDMQPSRRIDLPNQYLLLFDPLPCM